MENLFKCLVVTMIPLASNGETIFNTFGPGDSYNSGAAFAAGWNQTEDYGQAVAGRFFVNGGNYCLDSVTLALGHVQDTSRMTLSIVQDNGGLPTGSLVELVVGDLATVSSLNQVVTFNSSLNPVLGEGSAFWLLLGPATENLSTPDDNAAYQWFTSGVIGPTGLRGYNFGQNQWMPWDVYNSTLPAFRIEGIAIPEPASLWLLLGGLSLVGIRCWRRRH